MTGMNAYPNLSGHCPQRYGMKSLGEKIISKEERIAGKKPNNELTTKYVVTITNVAKIVFQRKIDVNLSPAKISAKASEEWNVGGYHSTWCINLLSFPYLKSM